VVQKIAKAPKQSPSSAPDAVQQPCLRILFGEVIAIGPGKIRLLELIEETGSISGAARRMNMSYRRAWLLVETMNRCFRAPLVETAQGGKGGGGAQVTELGQDVLQRYRQMERTAAEAVAGQMEELKALMADHPPEAIS
jgi:molybdate transport system regulatory protein